MKIKTNISIQPINELTLKEGVLTNNDILNKDEFREFLKPLLTEEVLGRLLNDLNKMAECIEGDRIKEAYIVWEKLQQDILLNQNYAVSLLFIENINSPEGDYSYKYATKEQNVLSNRGKLTRLSQLSQKLFHESIEEQINNHLLEFLNNINTYNMRWKFIQEIFNTGDSDSKRNAANARWKTHNWTYKNILYGDNPNWQGNAADAFINHMAHLHVQVFDGKSVDNKNLFATSVFNEEKDNIFNLLYASKNSTSWITGGDIIIKYNNQIYNIQLKTGQMLQQGKRRSRIGDKISTAKFLTFIKELKAEIQNKNIEEIISKMYEELKTSGWVEDTNQAISNIVKKMINNN